MLGWNRQQNSMLTFPAIDSRTSTAKLHISATNQDQNVRQRNAQSHIGIIPFHKRHSLGPTDLSEEAGLLSRKNVALPLLWSFLADATASLMAKKAEDARKNGGSPTA